MFWECPVVISLWTHVNLVLSSLLRIDWSVNPSLCLLNDDSGLCISSMQKRMLFAGFTAVKKTIIQNWFTPHMCREAYWIRSLLQIVTRSFTSLLRFGSLNALLTLPVEKDCVGKAKPRACVAKPGDIILLNESLRLSKMSLVAMYFVLQESVNTATLVHAPACVCFCFFLHYIALYYVLLYTQSTLQSYGGSLLNHHQCAASTWMMRRQPQYNGASVLTTHQLQVERRESHRANQVDGDY